MSWFLVILHFFIWKIGGVEASCNTMPLSGVGLIPRSSSAALSLAPHLDVEFPESLLDDVTIAHKLLAKRSKGSQRGTSISNSSVAQPNDTEWNGQSEESDAFEDTHNGRKSRRENQTSNTWTSSSGEILSDRMKLKTGQTSF